MKIYDVMRMGWRHGWEKVGEAYERWNGSIDVALDDVPTTSRFHLRLRDADKKQWYMDAAKKVAEANAIIDAHMANESIPEEQRQDDLRIFREAVRTQHWFFERKK
ncbi:MAG: hypothetical protein GWN93_26965 [Deltaproteobacteria bacterium]|nr:hypothetical protein [Deltaproteobacteria bacterium]